MGRRSRSELDSVERAHAMPAARKASGGSASPPPSQCFSANNFQTQHLANLHRPGAPQGITCVPDGIGGVHLWWKAPPPCPPGGEPELSAFQLRFSIDGGITWQVNDLRDRRVPGWRGAGPPWCNTSLGVYPPL